MAQVVFNVAEASERCVDCGEPFIDGCCRTMGCGYIWRRQPLTRAHIEFAARYMRDAEGDATSGGSGG